MIQKKIISATLLAGLFVAYSTFSATGLDENQPSNRTSSECKSISTKADCLPATPKPESLSLKTQNPSQLVALNPQSNEKQKEPIGIAEGFYSLLDKGGATFIAAVFASIISLITLVVSIWSSRRLARLTGLVNDQTNVKKENREYRLNQLTSFYDPIYTLLAANRNIFERIGPTSPMRKDEKYNTEETAEVWSKLSLDVIVPNNMRVCAIIEENLHYIEDNDDESLYLEFLTHAHAYRVFKEGAYEAYQLFQFPAALHESVKTYRETVRSSLKKIYN